MEKPEVGESQFVEEGHVGRQVAHGVVLWSRAEPGRTAVLLQPGDRSRQNSCKLSLVLIISSCEGLCTYLQGGFGGHFLKLLDLKFKSLVILAVSSFIDNFGRK